MKTEFAAFSFLLLVAPSAQAKWLYSGDCVLAEDELEGESIASGFDVCLNGRAGGQSSFVSGNSKENFATGYARGGASMHLGDAISLFANGHVVRRLPLGEDAIQDTDIDSDLLLARVGNASTDGLSLATGKFRAPFGIGIENGSESYRFFSDSFHWESHDFGHWLTWDDRKNFFVDFAYVSQAYTGKRIGTNGTQTVKPDWGGSLRAGYDFSALEGSRLVASLYGQNSGMRRSGLGFITVNSRGDTNWLEVIRTRSEPAGKREPFRQIIKYGYLSAPRSGGSWSVAIEEDRMQQRMGEFSHHINIRGYGEFTLGLLLRRTLASPYQDRWHVTSGLEVSL